ncbi:MAG: tetratricopeptide repeat protein [Bdellovibrionales bacterium]|nr:tetratricopeptide repeat protein [Bdellovibrionales bacterium]
MATYAASPDSLMELGDLYCDRGDFEQAVVKLQSAAEGFYLEGQVDQYLKATNKLLRMYAELEDFEAIDRTKDHLQDLVLKEQLHLSSKTYYSLGLCACFKGQNDSALEYLEKALSMALAKDDKESICYAINGLAIVYTALGRLDDALKEIYNLQVFFQVLDLPELKTSSEIMNGHILRRMGRFDQALEIFWKTYDSLKDNKNLYMYVSLLYAMGITYYQKGDSDMARLYLSLAQRTVDPSNLKHFSRILSEKLEMIGESEESKYDLIFDSASKSIIERKRGKIDFKNQFILLDMLRLFVNHPGEVFSKEALVGRVWRQDYDPMVHDNKIYVTIKRLRKMIEPDYEKPRYIYRAKNGYYLNKNTKVLVNG